MIPYHRRPSGLAGMLAVVLLSACDEGGGTDPSPELSAGTSTATAAIEAVVLSAEAPSGGSSPYSYQWHQSTTIDFTPSDANAIPGADELDHTAGDVEPGVPHFFRLIATDEEGDTAWYAEVNATPIGALTPGTANAEPGQESVALEATAPSGGLAPYSYQWHRSVESGFTPSGATELAGATAPSATVGDLEGGTTYYFKLLATDQSAQSVVYPEVSATPWSPPTAGSASAVAGAELVVLSATAPEGGVAPYTYQWHYSAIPGFTPSASNALPDATGPNAIATNLAAGTAYYFRLVVSDATGTTVVYPEVSAVPLAGLTAGSATARAEVGSVVLEATAPTGGTPPYTYQWHRDVFSGFTPSAATAVAGLTDLSETDAFLSSATTYYYRLVATDALGASVIYPLVWARPLGSFLPGDARAVGYPNRVELRATAPAGGRAPISYQWFRSETPGFVPGSSNAVVGLTSPETADASVTKGVDYYYRLVATDADGQTAIYDEVHVAPGGSSDLYGMWVAPDGTYLWITADSIVHYHQYWWPDPVYGPYWDLKVDCYDPQRFQILTTEGNEYEVRYHLRNNNQEFYTNPIGLELNGDELTTTFGDSRTAMPTTAVYTRSTLTPAELPECEYNSAGSVVCEDLPELPWFQNVSGTLAASDRLDTRGSHMDLYKLEGPDSVYIAHYRVTVTSAAFTGQAFTFTANGHEHPGLSVQPGMCLIVVVRSAEAGATGDYSVYADYEEVDQD